MERFFASTHVLIKKEISKKFRRWMAEEYQSDLRHSGYFNGGNLQFEVDSLSETHDEVTFIYFPKDRNSLEEYKADEKKGRLAIDRRMGEAWPDQIGAGKRIEFREYKTGYLTDYGEYISNSTKRGKFLLNDY